MANESEDYKRGWNEALEMVAKKQDQWSGHCAERAEEWKRTYRLQASKEATERAWSAKSWAEAIRNLKFDNIDFAL